MGKDNVIALEKPAGKIDFLTDLLRTGARDLIMQAVQDELTEFLTQHQAMTDGILEACLSQSGYYRQASN